jgi:hypothetical protein
LSGLATLVAAGQKSRDEIVSYFASLFRGKLVRQWSHVWVRLFFIAPIFTPKNCSTISNRLTMKVWLIPVTSALNMSNRTWRSAKIAFSRDPH